MPATQAPARAPAKAFVIGHPIAHSRSPLLHGHWLHSLGLAGSYQKIDVAPHALQEFFAGLQAAGFVGGNITVPHKLAAMAHVSRIDAAATAIGAVNTIWLENGAWIGGNTDADGFIANLDDRAPHWRNATRQCLILGAGGAARAAVYALVALGINVQIVNRTLAHAQALAFDFGPRVQAHGWSELEQLLPHTDLLVNTTALGMSGKPALHIDIARLKPSAMVHDIVYVPQETALLAAARACGHHVIDGLGMLLHQAVPGFARWFGVHPSVTPQLRALIEADISATLALRPTPQVLQPKS